MSIKAYEVGKEYEVDRETFAVNWGRCYSGKGRRFVVTRPVPAYPGYVFVWPIGGCLCPADTYSGRDKLLETHQLAPAHKEYINAVGSTESMCESLQHNRQNSLPNMS